MRRKPNILFVFSDQHRWCDMGCYGNKQVVSPNFDNFSKKAVVFDNCISNTPLCVPMRGSMLTGLYAPKHRALSNDLPIRTDIESIADVMNKNGYNTGYIGKWHLAGVPRDVAVSKSKRLGFNEWKVTNCNHDYFNGYYYDENNVRHEIDGYDAIEQTSMAIDFIDRNAGNPWGLVLSWGPPHNPYELVPDKYKEIYKDIDIDIRDNVCEPIIQSLNSNIDIAKIKESLRNYYAQISALDNEFGRILKKLDETNQLKNTIIVYTSDHGDMLGSQGMTKKQIFYNEAIKVPLMVYWEGKTINCFSNEMISLVDLPVSLLALANMKFDEKVDGKDLHRLFVDREAKGRESSYVMEFAACHEAHKRGGVAWRAIVNRDYTYAKTPDDGCVAMFDNKNDFYQLKNLAKSQDCQEIRYFLDSELDKYIKENDELLNAEDFLIKFDFVEEWNKSQEYFNLETIETDV